MSEFINNRENRVQQLLAFSRGIMNGEDGSQLITAYHEAIDSMTPYDMLAMEDRQLQMGITPQAIKKDIEKVINVFFKSLAKYPWEKPGPDTFLGHLLQENEALKHKLELIKAVLLQYTGREAASFSVMKTELLPKFLELSEFEQHYVKKENILFPYLEKTWENYRPLTVMWSLHDDIRRTLKECIAVLEKIDSSWTEFVDVMGRYFFLAYGMLQKEDLIIYPVAAETLSAEAWEAMYRQSFEYPFPFITPPIKQETENRRQPADGSTAAAEGFSSETGQMSYEQVLLAFNHLPVDITFVDEHDKVRFFNRAKDRFFPRSPAIVGRDVKNCHPPESVHIVEKIVNEFKNGNRDTADFRIKMRGKYILIRYFAVRDEDGHYRGCLEVGQDITEIVTMTDEKRLLDWD